MANENIKDLDIGKKFNANGRNFQVEKAELCHCKGCFFEEGKGFDCNEWALDLPECAAERRKDKEYVIFKEVKINKIHTDEIFTFKNLIDNGLDIIIRVEDTEFKLTRINKNSNFFPDKFLILVKQDDEKAWDIIGEETDYKEAELCFITEVNRYKDLSYEEVDNNV